MTRDEEGMIVKAYFESRDHVARWVAEEACHLPEELRPTHFSDAERPVRRTSNEIANSPAYNAFLARNTGGFFLHGAANRKIDVAMLTNVMSEVTIWTSPNDSALLKGIDCVIATFDAIGATYAYAGERCELEYRNHWQVEGPHGMASGWCGRDVRKYVSGLYWVNYFSHKYLRDMRLDVSQLADRTGGVCAPLSRGLMLRLYDAPSTWPQHQDRITTAIDEGGNIFSIRNVDMPGKIDSHPALLRWMQELHSKWP